LSDSEQYRLWAVPVRPKRHSERGDTNIIVLAVALPILLLIAGAALDVIRLPLAKQQLVSSLHAGLDGYSCRVTDDRKAPAGVSACCRPGARAGGGRQTDEEASQAAATAIQCLVRSQLAAKSARLYSFADDEVKASAWIYSAQPDKFGFLRDPVLLASAPAGEPAPAAALTALKRASAPLGPVSGFSAETGKPLRSGVKLLIVHGSVRVRYLFNFNDSSGSTEAAAGRLINAVLVLPVTDVPER
jgi:hypothetical protein